jgi:oxygen-independent coproporphyrinogen-3 oxidase
MSPAHAGEVVVEADQQVERIMLGVRLASGHPLGDLSEAGRVAAERAVADGLAESAAYGEGRLVLTRSGRLLADAVVRSLIA